jgi:molecular chaperone DnaJ
VPAGATKDYYAILGVNKTATGDEIRHAFRRRAREVHPDVNPAADAEERFKELNEAYDVLSDPRRREMYDRFGTVGSRAGSGPTPGGRPGGGAYADVGDIFSGINMEDLFSTFFGGAYSAQRGRAARIEGRDMSIAVYVSLAEAALGVEKEVVYDRLAPCDVCGGSGAGPEGHVVTCPDCGGTGQRVMQRQTLLGVMQTAIPCERCGHTGTIIEQACDECQGTGRAPDRERISVHVPPGVGDGQQLRVRDMGEAGVRGASAGDLIVTVRIKPDEYMQRDGDDLHCSARVSITQAALGADVPVCGVLEDNEIHIPAGSQPGDTVRLKARGMPRVRGGGRGDLIVHIDVEVPRKISGRQKELLLELSDELGDATDAEKSPMQKLKDWFTG